MTVIKQLRSESENDRPIDRLLSTKEAANLLSLSPSTLSTWRCTGHVRLPHVKIGRAVRYYERGLLEFLAKTASA